MYNSHTLLWASQCDKNLQSKNWQNLKDISMNPQSAGNSYTSLLKTNR